jgi:hypothetical protein
MEKFNTALLFEQVVFHGSELVGELSVVLSGSVMKGRSIVEGKGVGERMPSLQLRKNLSPSNIGIVPRQDTICKPRKMEYNSGMGVFLVSTGKDAAGLESREAS